MSENPSNHNKKRVLLVDDHPVLRKGLVRLIDSKNGFVICGEAGSATEAMTLMHELKPHLVIVDIGLPGASGIELTKTIRAQFPNIPVLILSMHEEALYASRALRAGAVGYIVKQDAIDNITTALQQTLAGQRYLSPSIAKQFQADGLQDQPQSSHDLIASLTDRELEIFELIGKGWDVREMAQALNVSPKTVETHRTNIREKLKLKNSREVARVALQWISEHPS
jgi:DNA-binding NarL/FixJ family response regulator